MAFVLTPLEASDVDAYLEIQFASFGAAKDSWTPILFPGGLTLELRTFLTDKLQKDLLKPDQHLFLVRDSVTNAPLAIVRWEWQREDKTVEEIDEEITKATKEREGEPAPPGMHAEGFAAFRNAQAATHREIMKGKKHAYLAILAVHPRHQGKGVGTVGLKWGLDKADEDGLPAYLEASSSGYSLYEKNGFKFIKDFPLRPREDLGIAHDAPIYCMLRGAVQKN